jgi:hypothetical protein
MTIATLSDIEQGAEAFLKAQTKVPLSPVEKAALREFVHFGVEATSGYELDLQMYALLLTGEPRKAADGLREHIEDCQPEPDHFGNAADRGYDERKERGEA